MPTQSGIIEGALPMKEVAGPGTPPSGYVYIYVKSDAKLYRKDDAGTETEVGGAVGMPYELAVAVPDEGSNLTTGTAKITFRMPCAMNVTVVRANVNTAPTGSTIICDIKEAGVSILSTLLSIDVSEETSVSAASQAVISDGALADDAEMTVDITQVGSTIPGKGLKILLRGTRA